MYFIIHCFVCRPSDSIVSEDAGIELRTFATLAFAVRRSNHSASSHPSYRINKIGLITVLIMSLTRQKGHYRKDYSKPGFTVCFFLSDTLIYN
jgi:hypothetical protein